MNKEWRKLIIAFNEFQYQLAKETGVLTLSRLLGFHFKPFIRYRLKRDKIII
jgi:hypothetical protein